MSDFVSICTAVLHLFQTQIHVFGFTLSYWDVLVWVTIAGIVISFVRGFFGE